ncbi:MAG: hypothetical protein M3680_07270 [Myxococcota bacterium]|nr:hypothetical protein [Myxococcota bacterium]
MRDSFWIGLGCLLVAGCAEQPRPAVEGDHHQYVVAGLRVPRNNLEARASSLDLNDDEAVDNQLGMVFGILEQRGLGVSGTAQAAVIRGKAIMLVALQTTSFSEARSSGLVTYLGTNPDPAACTDPSELATCGRHLMTRATYDVSPDSASDLARGRFDGGTFRARAGTMPIAIAIDAEVPLRIDLHAARVQLQNMSPDGGTAILAGGITATDLRTVVIPEAARQMSRIIAAECSGQPAGPSPCGCGPDSRARDLEELFDTNRDCVIEEAELRDNALVESLTASDLRIDGQELLSFGVGVELVPASFMPPPSAPE